MPADHFVYGLRLLANLPVPSLPILSKAHDEIDVEVRLKEGPGAAAPFSKTPEIFYASGNTDAQGCPVLRVGMLGKDYYGFFYVDGARYAIGRNGNEVWADWPDGYSLEDAATYIVGPVLGFVLRLRGVIPLHASSVAVDGRAIALLGAPGAGKSTTAAAFALRGYPILSEDVVALGEHDNSFCAQPGYPRVNLLPESVEALFGSPEALPLVTLTWGKRFLALNQGGLLFQGNPLPLSAIYVLGARQSDARTPSIEHVPVTSALTTLIANTYVNYVLDSAMRRQEFDVLGRLVCAVPVRLVRPSADPAHLSELCHAIAEDAREIYRTKESHHAQLCHQRQ